MGNDGTENPKNPNVGSLKQESKLTATSDICVTSIMISFAFNPV